MGAEALLEQITEQPVEQRRIAVDGVALLAQVVDEQLMAAAMDRFLAHVALCLLDQRRIRQHRQGAAPHCLRQHPLERREKQVHRVHQVGARRISVQPVARDLPPKDELSATGPYKIGIIRAPLETTRFRGQRL